MTMKDTAGREMGDAINGAAGAPATNGAGVALHVGRHRTSRRRWFWGLRYDASPRVLEDGSTWEPVRAVG